LSINRIIMDDDPPNKEILKWPIGKKQNPLVREIVDWIQRYSIALDAGGTPRTSPCGRPCQIPSKP